MLSLDGSSLCADAPAVSCLGFWKPTARMHWKLFKELFIHLLDIQSLFDAAADAMADHQACEVVAVDEHDPFAQLFRFDVPMVRRWRK